MDKQDRVPMLDDNMPPPEPDDGDEDDDDEWVEEALLQAAWEFVNRILLSW